MLIRRRREIEFEISENNKTKVILFKPETRGFNCEQADSNIIIFRGGPNPCLCTKLG